MFQVLAVRELKAARHGRGRLLAAVIALAGTGATGATVTIKTVVNNDPEACASLLAMVKAAGVPDMSDAQLCDFRFARLPASQTKGFAFPTWTEMPVADPSAMYFKLLNVNSAPDKISTYGYPWTDLTNNAAKEAANHNLVFYKTELPLEGKGAPLTFVQMDIKQCSKLPWRQQLGVPFYAVFDQPDLKHSESVRPTDFDGAQIALWKGHIPVGLSINSRWLWEKFVPSPPMLQITLQELARNLTNELSVGPFGGNIHSYGVCAFNIFNTAKPHKEIK